MIGFPDKILNVTYVDGEYKEVITMGFDRHWRQTNALFWLQLNITGNQTYFEQRKNFIKYVNIKQLRELRHPVERNKYETGWF